MKKIFVLMLVLGGLIGSTLLYADCYDECMSIKGCWHKGETYSSYCGSAEVNCESECERKAQKGGGKSYGAIAYSRDDGSYGYSSRQNSRDEAENLALNYCKQYNKHCRSLVWFYNSCGAVAADGKKTGWGQADFEDEAQQKALRSCKKARGKNCQIQVSHCSF